MTPKSCATCKHWRTLRATDNWGDCDLVKIDPLEAVSLPLAMLTVTDEACGCASPDFTAQLRTRDVFYCAEFTPKDGRQTTGS